MSSLMTATDSEQWVIRDDVPVTDECTVERFNTRTREIITHRLTADRLQKFADECNRKIKETGDESPIIVGHTRKGVPEWEQPPIVGYADKYKVGKHPKSGAPTLFARMKFYPESQVGPTMLSVDEILKRFPRRSPEIFLEDNEIDSISLLGATSPERNLGLLRLAKAAEVDMPPEAPAAPPAAPAPAAAPPAGGGGCEELCMALMAVIEQFMGGGPEQMEAASPDGPNTAEPTPAQFAACGPTNAALPEQEKVRMARESENIRVNRLEAELQSLKAEREQEKLQLRSERFERRLTQLEAENYDLKRAEELQDLLTMTDEQAERHFDRIKTKYARAGGNSFIRTADVEEGGAGNNPYRDTLQLQKAEAHMLRHPGMGFHEALAAVKAG